MPEGIDKPYEPTDNPFPDMEINIVNGTKNLWDFLERREPFNGEQRVISDEEKEAVSVQFTSAFDDCMLQNIESVKSHRIGVSPSTNNNLSLEYDCRDGYNKFTVSLRQFDEEKRVDVQHVQGGFCRESAAYLTEPDGTIIRLDLGDSQDRAKRTEFLKADNPIDHTLNKLQELRHEISESRANLDLEKAMGVNAQPISLDEMQRLAELIDSSNVNKPW